MKRLTDYVIFHDKQLEKKYANARIPMATLYEAYFDGALDIPGDIYALLRDRNQFVNYRLTPQHVNHFLNEQLKSGRVETAAKPAEQKGLSAANAGVRVFRARDALRRRVMESCGTCAEHGCLDCSCARR